MKSITIRVKSAIIGAAIGNNAIIISDIRLKEAIISKTVMLANILLIPCFGVSGTFLGYAAIVICAQYLNGFIFVPSLCLAIAFRARHSFNGGGMQRRIYKYVNVQLIDKQ